MNQHLTLVKRRVQIFLGIWLSASLGGAGPSPADVRQLWKGEFHRTSPEPWTGPIEIYFRYESDGDPPHKLDGVLIWPTLGRARIRIEGKRLADGSLEFVEKSCLDGDCSQLSRGRKHRLLFRKSILTFDGTVTDSFGVRGRYSLHQ